MRSSSPMKLYSNQSKSTSTISNDGSDCGPPRKLQVSQGNIKLEDNTSNGTKLGSHSSNGSFVSEIPSVGTNSMASNTRNKVHASVKTLQSNSNPNEAESSTSSRNAKNTSNCVKTNYILVPKCVPFLCWEMMNDPIFEMKKNSSSNTKILRAKQRIGCRCLVRDGKIAIVTSCGCNFKDKTHISLENKLCSVLSQSFIDNHLDYQSRNCAFRFLLTVDYELESYAYDYKIWLKFENKMSPSE